MSVAQLSPIFLSRVYASNLYHVISFFLVVKYYHSLYLFCCQIDLTMKSETCSKLVVALNKQFVVSFIIQYIYIYIWCVSKLGNILKVWFPIFESSLQATVI